MNRNISRKSGPSQLQMRILRMRTRELADRLDRKAEQVRARNHKAWADDTDMVKYTDKDYKSYQKISELMRKGELKRAALMANMLDTNAREDLPMTVWNFLEKFC